MAQLLSSSNFCPSLKANMKTQREETKQKNTQLRCTFFGPFCAVNWGGGERQKRQKCWLWLGQLPPKLLGPDFFWGEGQGPKSSVSPSKPNAFGEISRNFAGLFRGGGRTECTAVAAIQLRMRMRSLTRPENLLANFSHQISNKNCE